MGQKGPTNGENVSFFFFDRFYHSFPSSLVDPVRDPTRGLATRSRRSALFAAPQSSDRQAITPSADPTWTLPCLSKSHSQLGRPSGPPAVRPLGHSN